MLQLLLQTRLICHFINTHVPRQCNLLHLQFFENSLRNLQILNILKSLAGLCNIIFGFWCVVHELDDSQQRSILAGTVWPITQSIFLHEVLPCPPCLPQVPQLKRSKKKAAQSLTSMSMPLKVLKDFKVMFHALKVSHSNKSFMQLGNCMSAFTSSASNWIVPTSMFLVCFRKTCANTAAILSCFGLGIYIYI